MGAMKKILIVSDGIPHTGYGRTAQAVVQALKGRFEIILLGLNSFGDPVEMGCPVYPAYAGGDSWGRNRLPALLASFNPDTVLLIHDPNVLDIYLPLLEGRKTVAWTAVDGELLRGPSWASLARLDVLIPLTQFGKFQLERVGASPREPLGLGVDPHEFYPVSQAEARLSLGLPLEGFVVGSVQGNQTRKRLDLLCEAFARFWNPGVHAYLLYHGPRVSPQGYDLLALANYYGYGSRLLLTHLDHDALPEYTGAGLRSIYAAMDVQITTSSGEGWGLPPLEGMACGVPQIVPDFAALGEWTGDAALKVAVPHLQVRPGLPTLGRCPDPQALADALNSLHTDTQTRLELREKGLTLAQDPRFDWTPLTAQLERYL